MISAATSGPTRDALAALRAAVARAAHPAGFPGLLPTALALEGLAASEAPAVPREDALTVARSRVVAAASSGTLATLSRRDLRDAAWLLWAPREPLWGLPGLLDVVAGAAERSGGLRRGLIEAWLQGFDPESPGTRQGASALRRVVDAVQDHRLEPWRRADARFDLFGPSAAPDIVARALLHDEADVEAVVKAAGLSGPDRRTSGLARAVQGALLRAVPSSLRGPRALTVVERAFAFLAPEGTLRLAEPMAWGALARGLTAPWLETDAPVEAARAAVQTFLLRHLGDPRTRPERWRHAGDEAVALVRRWLAKASLEAFFDLVDEHALDAQWRYRRAFWLGVLAKGAVDDAWLALGASVHASARAVRDLGGAFARLERARTDATHSVLLLRVGPLVLCEWSHNGKLRAWSADGRATPKLGRGIYGRDELMMTGLNFPPSSYDGRGGAKGGGGLAHHGSETGHWQRSAAALLLEKAGVRLTPRDWAPYR